MFPLNAAAAAGGAKVTITGGAFNSTVPFTPTDPSIDVRFDTDNNVFRFRAESPSIQLSPLTDWVRPVTPSSNYEIFTSNAGPDAVDAGSDVLDTWLSLSTIRNWGVTRTNNSAGNDSIVLTISIRRVGTTTVLDSGVYNLMATRQTP